MAITRIEPDNVLDPEDPFEALLDMARLHKKKRADYAADTRQDLAVYAVLSLVYAQEHRLGELPF